MNSEKAKERKGEKAKKRECEKAKVRNSEKASALTVNDALSLFRLFAFSLFIVLSSCSQNKFVLQKNTGWPIEGRILADKDNVDVVDNNHLLIADSAQVAMRCVELTDGVFDTEIKFEGAKQLSVQFRTTPFDDSVKHQSGFSILLTEFETKLVSVDTAIITPVLLPMNAPFRLIVRQHGNFFDVEVACANVGRIHSKDPSTQWILASVPGGGGVHFIDPQFKRIITDFTEENPRKFEE